MSKFRRQLYKKRNWQINLMKFEKTKKFVNEEIFFDLNLFILTFTNSFLIFFLFEIFADFKKRKIQNFNFFLIAFLSFSNFYKKKKDNVFIAFILIWKYLLSSLFLKLNCEISSDTIFLYFCLLNFIYSFDFSKCQILNEKKIDDEKKYKLNQYQKYKEVEGVKEVKEFKEVEEFDYKEFEDVKESKEFDYRKYIKLKEFRMVDYKEFDHRKYKDLKEFREFEDVKESRNKNYWCSINQLQKNQEKCNMSYEYESNKENILFNKYKYKNEFYNQYTISDKYTMEKNYESCIGLKNNENRNDELNNELKKKENYNRNLNNEQRTNEERIDELNNELKNNENYNRNLNNEQRTNEERIDELNNELKNNENFNCNLNNKQRTNEERIDELNNELKNNENYNRNLNNEQRTNEERIDDLNNELKNNENFNRNLNNKQRNNELKYNEIQNFSLFYEESESIQLNYNGNLSQIIYKNKENVMKCYKTKFFISYQNILQHIKFRYLRIKESILILICLFVRLGSSMEIIKKEENAKSTKNYKETDITYNKENNLNTINQSTSKIKNYIYKQEFTHKANKTLEKKYIFLSGNSHHHKRNLTYKNKANVFGIIINSIKSDSLKNISLTVYFRNHSSKSKNHSTSSKMIKNKRKNGHITNKLHFKNKINHIKLMNQNEYKIFLQKTVGSNFSIFRRKQSFNYMQIQKLKYLIEKKNKQNNKSKSKSKELTDYNTQTHEILKKRQSLGYENTDNSNNFKSLKNKKEVQSIVNGKINYENCQNKVIKIRKNKKIRKNNKSFLTIEDTYPPNKLKEVPIIGITSGISSTIILCSRLNNVEQVTGLLWLGFFIYVILPKYLFKNNIHKKYPLYYGYLISIMLVFYIIKPKIFFLYLIFLLTFQVICKIMIIYLNWKVEIENIKNYS